jgi:hypothetical protein
MDRIKRFLIVVWVAGCGGGGGGSGMDPDASTTPGDGNPGGDATDASQNPVDGGTLAANDRCASATTINLSDMHVDLTANPAGSHADLAAPCGAGGDPDVYFKFTLTRRELIYADTFGTSSGTTLFFASSCSTAGKGSSPASSGDVVCSSAACGTGQSQVAALLEARPEPYYLVLAGQGAATIHFQHAEVGSGGTVEHLEPGSSTMTGSTTEFGDLNVCMAGGGENAYWWQTCPSDAGGAFVGSTCGTGFDTMLSFQTPGTETVVCEDDDDTCANNHRASTVRATIPAGAGLFVISVEGRSTAAFGDYTLSASRP